MHATGVAGVVAGAGPPPPAGSAVGPQSPAAPYHTGRSTANAFLPPPRACVLLRCWIGCAAAAMEMMEDLESESMCLGVIKGSRPFPGVGAWVIVIWWGRGGGGIGTSCRQLAHWYPGRRTPTPFCPHQCGADRVDGLIQALAACCKLFTLLFRSVHVGEGRLVCFAYPRH
jgi:hypothetical protein